MMADYLIPERQARELGAWLSLPSPPERVRIECCSWLEFFGRLTVGLIFVAFTLLASVVGAA